MSDLSDPPSHLIERYWDARAGVRQDVADLADQMRRCACREGRLGWSGVPLSHRVGRFLRQHLVSLLVLAALLATAISAAA